MHLADRSFELSPLNDAFAGSRKKVCIYGNGIGKEEAPLDDIEWAVWTCNLCAPFDKRGRLRADRWFDLHQRIAQTDDDMRWIAKCPVPIYLPPDLMEASPSATYFPLSEIEEKFGVSYWACTFAYQIALVLHEGTAHTIGLYGVELAFGDRRERTVEWANTAYWIGRAHERGLKILTPEGSILGAHSARYGFEYTEEKSTVEDYVSSMEWIDKRHGDRPKRGAVTAH